MADYYGNKELKEAMGLGTGRRFHGNQYVGKTWRTFKLIVAGTWIGTKEMYHNPGKVMLAVLMLGQTAMAFSVSAHPHLLSIKSAWADLTNVDTVYVNSNTATSTDEIDLSKLDADKVLEIVASCESGKKQFNANGTVVKNINVDEKTGKPTGTIDYGYYQINSTHEAEAAQNGWSIYEYEGNKAMAYLLYDRNGLRDWRSSKHCWAQLL